MFNKLSNLFTDEIKDSVMGKLFDNDDVDNKNISEDAVKTGTDSIFDSLKDELLDGKLDDIRISDIGRYTSNFTPLRMNDLETNSNTRLLMNLNEGDGTSIGDASGNFTSISLRSSPNMPNWGFEQLVQTGLDFSLETEIPVFLAPALPFFLLR